MLIVSAGYGGHHVGHLKAIFDEKGEVVSFEGDTVPMDEKIMQDKEITAQIKAVQQEVNAVLNEKIFIAWLDNALHMLYGVCFLQRATG